MITKSSLYSRDRGMKSSLSRLLQNRYFGYLLFTSLILFKLVFIHHNLNIPNIDMGPLDYIIAIGSILLASFWVFWLPPRGRSVAYVILNVLLTALIFSDLVYYRYFQDFITVPVLLQAGQVDSLGDSIESLLKWTDLIFFIDWLLYIPYQVLAKTRSRRDSIHDSYIPRPLFLKQALKRTFAGIAVFVLGCILTFAPIKDYTSTWAKGIFEGNWWNLSLYNVTGLLGFHGYDIYRYGKEHFGPKKELPQAELDEIKDWFAVRSNELHVKNDTFGAYSGSNVMVVQVEAMMNFMIGQSINGQEITPNFNKLMKESMYFSNYYHQTGQGRTSDADFSTNTSLHPLGAGSVFVRYPDSKYDSLSSILDEKGYETAVFHAYDSSFWNRYTMYKEMGYDHFYSIKDFKIDEPLGWSLGDKSFLKQSLNMMKSDRQPFYSFLITLSSHHPYKLAKETQKLNVGEFEGTIFGDYLQSIHYVDEALGEMVQQMKEQGLWDNTILFIYGDHDNSINDKDDYEKFLHKPISNLDMEQIMNQVPLLVHLPDGRNGGETKTQAEGQLDLTPSVLHLLGIQAEHYYMMGNNLFDDQQKDKLVVLRSGAFSDSKVFYIPSADNIFENGSCYDLSTRQMTDVNVCRRGYEEGQKRLNISDKVITYDLLARLENEQNK
ncbi:LTA synthase family protein [Paenibacillus sediminis]|uniref:Phosphoglycerol transferase MdoB-like AlkP superfamily enzyme n=1 Tax=Paenibacillus sediminis TaxID=664909 RepID=A0ABS4H5N5_9BACL|nr:LTA synthase family protein [Paenibacillus sediminis]MBP1937776.1 phosphoglycerol transferase MdoB-like AlkP superfamily enzyme [Paenibacillus sediminis]